MRLFVSMFKFAFYVSKQTRYDIQSVFVVVSKTSSFWFLNMLNIAQKSNAQRSNAKNHTRTGRNPAKSHNS